jgi:hypothetical protein
VSLLGALTPLGKEARSRLWTRCVLAYTLAGTLSSTLVGALLGSIGSPYIFRPARGLLLYLGSVCAIVLAAREWGWIAFRLPERRCQTEPFWVHRFGFPTASLMWGFHIGLGFATRITFGGFWWLAILIVILGNSRYGALIMSTYWLGRISPIWLAPNWLRQRELDKFMDAMWVNKESSRRLSGASLLWAAVIGAVLARTDIVLAK